MMLSDLPQTDIDIFSEDTMRDPAPVWAEIRELGSVVFLSRWDTWIVTRYDEVREVLTDWQTFTSAKGTVFSDEMSAMLGETPLTTDPPLHDTLRGVLSEKLAPRALRKLNAPIVDRADELIAEAVAAGSFEGMESLCKRLPVDIVADLIGLPVEGREILLPGAEAFFTTFGPYDDRLLALMPSIEEFVAYMGRVTSRDVLAPGSWGTAILDAVDAGVIGEEHAIPLMSAYLIAGMDTTVHSLGFYLTNLAENPAAWAALKKDPTLIGSGFEETLRLGTPVQLSYRVTTRQVELGGHTIPEGKRILLCNAAANRDPRHYDDPDTFDIHRNPVDHLTLGYGTHGCAGQGLARLEARALITALLERVDSIELTGPVERQSHVPGFAGIRRLPLSLTTA
ncbi:putative cytochrome P450 hydroxylase [Rhodococcus wratislaviensis]|uniref:Putative cytochrome P450 hydroxylase n=1 Tax=Rhodococcus wratislaviensis TaxID=44752 RepID=A0A402C3F0_RHOWR|nr:cytochrome P450 [Rhodococcus wratislaviensis]GCE38165.1 putative cytochrome P450 hydroxylase [Rhodococcus wratislaviensis]